MQSFVGSAGQYGLEVKIKYDGILWAIILIVKKIIFISIFNQPSSFMINHLIFCAERHLHKDVYAFDSEL